MKTRHKRIALIVGGLVILGAVVGINLKDLVPDSRQKAAKMQLGELRTALQIYINDNGFPPTIAEIGSVHYRFERLSVTLTR